MDEEKIKEIFSDEEFVKSLFALETPQEVQAAVSAKGIDLSIAEIEWIRERILSGNGELSEDELDNVAGGLIITTTSIMIGTLIIGACMGFATGVTVGASIGFGCWFTGGRW